MDAAKLRIVGGTRQGEEYALELPVTIGRGRDNSIALCEALVSRQHCRISLREDSLVVSDLDSLNGTYVGSERIAGETLLPPGQLLTVGTVTFRAIYAGYESADGQEEIQPDGTDADSHVLSEDTVNLGESGTVVDPTVSPAAEPIVNPADSAGVVPAPKFKSKSIVAKPASHAQTDSSDG